MSDKELSFIIYKISLYIFLASKENEVNMEFRLLALAKISQFFT